MRPRARSACLVAICGVVISTEHRRIWRIHMAKLIWSVPCSRILLDQPSNRVSYIDVLDGVSLPSFPPLAPLTFIGMFFQRENETKLEVRVRAYGGDRSGEHTSENQS